VWYVNAEKESERDYCMQKQLQLAGIEPHRYKADSFGTCIDKETFVDCLQRQGYGDCVQGGVDWTAVSVHGANETNSLEVSSRIIANWCSHKRLFSQLASSSDPPEFFLILEDDAYLNYTTMSPEIEKFLMAHRGMDWDLVIVDMMFTQVDYVYHNKLRGGVCNAYEASRHDGRPVWKVPRVEGNATGSGSSIQGCLVERCSFCGAQAFLVQTSSLKRLVSIMEGMPTVPLDWFPRHLPNALAWRPEVALNPRGLDRRAPEFCSAKVLVSNIDKHNTSDGHLDHPQGKSRTSKSASVSGKYAFVQLAVDMPGAIPGTSLWPVLPMARALLRVGSKYPLLLLTNLSQSLDGAPLDQALQKLNCRLLPVSDVPLPSALLQSFNPTFMQRWKFAWLKLQVWRLTEFDKLVWMDSDSIITRNVDWLFHQSGTWMQRDNWECTDAFRGNPTCSGIMLLEPNEDTFAGMMQYSSTLRSLYFGDQALIEGYFRDILGTPVRLLDHVDAAFGHCIGRTLPGVSNRDMQSPVVKHIWDIPAFVHKSSRENECFGFNYTLQLVSNNGTTQNTCDNHPLGKWWRELFCDAASITEITSSSVFSVCNDFAQSTYASLESTSKHSPLRNSLASVFL
jgi:hypothetical protein